MASGTAKVGLVAVVMFAVLYQLSIKTIIFVTVGLGRELQPLSDFPYKCRRIHDARLSACEDMWLSDSTRTLFLACSDPTSRQQWMPNIHRFNYSGRGLNDAVIAMKIDEPKGDSFDYKVLKTPNFSGVKGDGRLHVVGMTGIYKPRREELYLVNSRPSIDPVSGEFLDNESVGGNATIERFTVHSADGTLRHVKTYADPQIATPNNVAVTGNGGLYYTNDHGPHKTGFYHHLSMYIGTGDVSYCPPEGRCKKVAGRLKFPNGLTIGRDGLLYVPSAAAGGIYVYDQHANGDLTQVDYIDIPYGMDNLSVDMKGNIFASALPKGLESLKAFDDPYTVSPPATVLRVTKSRDGEYSWEKVLEDAYGEALGMTTTTIHDATTGRLFISGVVSPYITLCEPK